MLHFGVHLRGIGQTVGPAYPCAWLVIPDNFGCGGGMIDFFAGLLLGLPAAGGAGRFMARKAADGGRAATGYRGSTWPCRRQQPW